MDKEKAPASFIAKFETAKGDFEIEVTRPGRYRRLDLVFSIIESLL